MTFPESTTAVVHIDLRTGAAALTTAQAVRDRVAEQLGRAGLPEPDHPLLLVTDTPAGLTGHQLQYELLSNYRAVGDTRILVLLVGSSPGSYAGGEEAYGPDRRLVRPATLRASTIGLVWAGDLRSARTALERPEPDDPASLAVLVDLLSVPDVFVRVLDDLGGLPDSVAAPGVRLLEQDLPPEVRDRAWRDALSRFAGEDGGGASPVTLPPAARLPEPLGALVSGREGRPHGHRQPNGPADLAHRTCADSLDRVDDDLVALRALPGLLSPARREALESDLDQARGHLDEFRALVERALQGSGSSAAAEAAARLGALGLRVPPAESAGERVGEGLRELARTLLDEGLALRSVAQHFTALAGRVEPVPGTALLHRLDDHSEEAVHRGSATEYAAPPRTPAAPLALAGAAGLLGGLWQGALLPLALVVPVVFVAVAVWGARRLRTGRRTARWTVGPRVAAVAGAVAGAAAAYATAPPAWLGVTGLLAGLGLTAEAVRRLWRGVATSWAAGRGTTALRTALDGLDALLAELVREHWAAEERLYCADAARSVAGMLRATAAAADAQAVPEPAAPAGASASGPYGDEDWLSAPSALEDPGAETAHDGADDGDWAAAYTWESGSPGDRDNTYATQAPDNPYATSAPDNAYAFPAPGDAYATPAPKAAPADAAPWEDTATRAPRWLDREIGEGGPDLVATLAGDLRATVMVAMHPYWGAVERGQAGALAVRRTEERVRDVLSDARHHLWHNGVLAPPRHPAEHRARTSAAGLLGTDSLRVAELMGRDTDGQAVVQLSSPEQGSLLSRDPEAARWIRFAPRTLQGEVETAWHKSGSPAPDGALWTSSGRYAGLIRLTPLRMGVVDTVLPRQSRGGSTRPDHPDDTGGTDYADRTDDTGGTDYADRTDGTYSTARTAGTETGGDEGW
ncbi:hypothetical protein [Streptomyces cyaneofuscatus]|uniref:hypothetical protein n=1 Tax=Streptomyces cyaneofuscatus TaxID=66883 RepID=UPI0030B8EE79